MSFTLDDTDLKILEHLQPNACMSNAELARLLGMAPSAVLERVKKLETRGVITGYPARLNASALGLKLLAFIFIKSSEGPGNAQVAEQLASLPEVLELHHIAGEDCYIAKVRARDPQSLVQFMRAQFSKVKGILSTKTTIVLDTVKEDNHLPIPKTPEP
ncbi:MAG TPA: Lrp/AsnC family transcriptional regulator [Chitinophagaceae bacterium]|jgi:Lrp/AsnC family leucine-responsive transcriptional regulator|nr:Lrp/AsnC family transcriptional regulator [Chitinophagaceae bacterium]